MSYLIQLLPCLVILCNDGLVLDHDRLLLLLKVFFLCLSTARRVLGAGRYGRAIIYIYMQALNISLGSVTKRLRYHPPPADFHTKHTHSDDTTLNIYPSHSYLVLHS